MPKDRSKIPRGGASRHVREVSFVRLSQRAAMPSPSVLPERVGGRATKITKVLGPKARIQEKVDSNEMMKEQLESMLINLYPPTG